MTLPDHAGGAQPRSDAGRRSTVGLGGPDEQRRSAWLALDQSSIMSVELLSAIFTWGGVGWLLDRWLQTGPWLAGTGILMGFAAGLYLVWLRSKQMLERDAAEAAARAEATEGPARATH